MNIKKANKIRDMVDRIEFYTYMIKSIKESDKVNLSCDMDDFKLGDKLLDIIVDYCKNENQKLQKELEEL